MKGRDPLQTYIYNGVPQTEVNFRIELPVDAGKYGYDKIYYSGTIDRVVIDEHDQLFIVEYKTAKQVMTMHYAVDSQISSYCWAGLHLYNRPVAGVIYQQHLKDIPEDPPLLSTGRFSTNKQLRTTHRHYRQCLEKMYQDVRLAPAANVEHLNWLASQEDQDKDKFVRRDKVYRNLHQCEAEGNKIMLELEDMLNPDLPLYPNPQRDCAFLCSFSGTCASMDDGSDWQYELDIMTASRDATYDSWRKYINQEAEGSMFS